MCEAQIYFKKHKKTEVERRLISLGARMPGWDASSAGGGSGALSLL